MSELQGEAVRNDQQGLICAYQLNRTHQNKLNWDQIPSVQKENGTIWIHFDREDPGCREWLHTLSNLPPFVTEALLEEETRPRFFIHQDGLLIILRGVNLNQGADPEDMVSVRLWIEPTRVISLRHRSIMAIQDIRDEISQGSGPLNAGDFLLRLIDRLTDRMEPVVNKLIQNVDEIEDHILEQAHVKFRGRLADLRRQAILLRRYIAPQRDLLSRLQVEPLSWLTATHRLQLRENTDHLLRYVEDLDACRERIAIQREELTARQAEQMTKNTYILTIVAGVFLPLSFLTGLLGINVGGIPGAQDATAFWVVCGIIGGLIAIQIWIYRLLKIF